MNSIKRFLIVIIVIGFVGWTGIDQGRSQSDPVVDTSHLRQEAESILLRSLDDPQSQVRSAVILSLASIRMPEAVPKLLALLKQSQEQLSHDIITALGNQLPDPAIVDALIERLQKDLTDYVRRQAALSLARLGDRRAVPALIERLHNDPEERVRAAAAKALGILHDPAALPALQGELNRLRALLDHPAEAEQMSAVFAGVVGALFAFKEKSAISVFKAILEAQDPVIPATLFYGSDIIEMVITARDTADSAFISEISETIHPLLKHSNSLIRLRSALVLRVLGDTSVIPVITDSLEYAKEIGSFDRSFHILEISFFGIFGLVYDDALVPILSELIDVLGPFSPNQTLFDSPLLRGFLTIVLGAIGSESAVLKIIAYLNDPSPPNPRIPDADRTAKSFALLGLGMASRPASGIVPQTGLILSTLITFADNPDRLLREMAVQMLGFVDNPIALPTLIRILEDRELSGGIEMREYAIGALAQIGDLTTLPILSVLFAESNKVIRIEAAAAVLQIIDGKKSSSVALIGGSQSMAVISFTSFPSISKMRLSMRRALPK